MPLMPVVGARIAPGCGTNGTRRLLGQPEWLSGAAAPGHLALKAGMDGTPLQRSKRIAWTNIPRNLVRPDTWPQNIADIEGHVLYAAMYEAWSQMVSAACSDEVAIRQIGDLLDWYRGSRTYCNKQEKPAENIRGVNNLLFPSMFLWISCRCRHPI